MNDETQPNVSTQKQTVGQIRILVEHDANYVTFRYIWEGGDVIAISLALLLEADSNQIYWSKKWLMFGPYVLELVGIKDSSSLLFRRVRSANT